MATASPDLRIPVGDLTPPLEISLKDGDEPQNLTDVITAVAHFQRWRSDDDEIVYDCDIEAPTLNGVVQIVWDADLKVPPPAGLYRVWVVVTFSDTKPQSFPQERDLLIEFWTHGKS